MNYDAPLYQLMKRYAQCARELEDVAQRIDEANHEHKRLCSVSSTLAEERIIEHLEKIPEQLKVMQTTMETCAQLIDCAVRIQEPVDSINP